MKTNWQTKKIGDICVLKPPKSEARKTLSISDPVSFVPMEDLGIFTKRFNTLHERKLKDVAGSYTYFANGDVLMAKITPCFENGKIGIAGDLKNGVGFGSSEYFVFRPKEEIYSDYLYYFLLTDDFREEGQRVMSGAVGHKRVPKEFVENYEIPLPSIVEQKQIVKKLDEVFEKVATAKGNAEKNLQNSKELFESYLQNVFTNRGKDWEENKLEVLTLKIGSGATPRGGKNSYKKCGIALVRSMNVHDRNFVDKNLAFIDDKQAKDLANVTLTDGDVLLNITGASVTRCCVLPKEYLPARVNQHVSILRPKPDVIDSVFLNYLLTSKHYKDQLQVIGGQGATRQAITKLQLENFLIRYPSLTEQRMIVKKLDALSVETKKLEKIYEQKLADLEELKKSVLSKTFHAEL